VWGLGRNGEYFFAIWFGAQDLALKKLMKVVEQHHGSSD
jgi:hypothetical protein